MTRVTDPPQANGPAAEGGHAGSNPIEVNAFRAPPLDEPRTAPQSAASCASAQSARPEAVRQADGRGRTNTSYLLLGLIGSIGIAVAGSRPIGLLGVALLTWAWYAGRRTIGWRTAVLWALPLLVVPPLFSGDAYAYACQGQLLGHGLSPYRHGVADLPCTWVDRVPPLWRHTPTPYGPLWVVITEAASAMDRLWVAIGVLRLVALAGIALAVAYGRRLARDTGADPDRVAWLAASPLVLLHAVAGVHNDALLAGLVVAGLAVAVRARWGVAAGAVLGLAVAVKVTALVAVPFAVLLVPRRAIAGVVAGVAGGPPATCCAPPAARISRPPPSRWPAPPA
ncbi:MAG: hypothetical protein AUI14_04140 [Actinobacteria bacterium 13_2_20CM_2_71_6]|nr:MAG: hypothetical protein AUI14_04140 [Actinobacteria bacterium 13_2_20CM_2_71_6]